MFVRLVNLVEFTKTIIRNVPTRTEGSARVFVEVMFVNFYSPQSHNSS